jgi:hypothetical protein
MKPELRRFGREISANRGGNEEFTEGDRMYMAGAAAAGETHEDIAKAVGAKGREVVTRIIGRTKTRGNSQIRTVKFLFL